MSEIANLLHEAIALNENCAPLLLKALEYQQLEQNANMEQNHSIVAKINSWMNNGLTRGQAFTTLLQYLPGCDVDLLNERGLIWLNTTIKTCDSKNGSLIAQGFDVIRILVERSEDAPEFMKQLNHSVMQKILEAAYNAPENAEHNAINCVIQCMLTYPGPCGPSKNVIEKFALKYIDSSNTELVRGAAVLLLLMQQTRSGGEAKVMHKKYYTEYHLQIIGSLHQYLNELFKDVEENYDFDADIDNLKLKLPELRISNDPVTKIAQLAQRVINLLIFLKEAFKSPFSVGKVVRPNKILGLVRRGLDVNQKSILRNVIVDNLLLCSVIPQIHIHLFEVLDAFVGLLQCNVRLFCKDIVLTYESSLKWSNNKGRQLGCKKPHSSLRISIYNSLTNYCLVLEKGSLIESIGEVLVENIIEDTLPFQSKVTLQSDAANNLSKRAKKKLQKVQNESTNLAKQHQTKSNSHSNWKNTDEHNFSLCVSALEALAAFILACGTEIKPTLQRTLQQHVVQLCFQISDGRTFDKTHLYFSDSCRKSLYEALFSLTMNSHHLVPPPLQYAIKILANACLVDPSKKVREKCRILMAGIEKIVNPQRTTPYIKVSEEELTNAIKELRHGKEFQNEFNDNSNDALDSVIDLDDGDDDPAPTKATNDNDTVIDLDEDTFDKDESYKEMEYVEPEKAMETKENRMDYIKDTDELLCLNEIATEPPQKRLKQDSDDCFVEELIETFVDE